MFGININDIGDYIFAIGLFFLFLQLIVCFSIIALNSHIKDLVDLEYKKYKEGKQNANSVSSEPGSDRPSES